MLRKLQIFGNRRKLPEKRAAKRPEKTHRGSPQTVTQEDRIKMLYAQAIATVFSARKIGGSVVAGTRGARHLTLAVGLANPLQLDTALALRESLALTAGVGAVLAQRHHSIIAFQFELLRRYWKSYTLQDVSGAGVGLAQGNRQINFSFDGAPHTGCFGTTGSGKSETIRTILASQLGLHDPADLGIVVCDPHRDYEEFERSAHLLAPIAHDAESISRVLGWVSAELARREAANERDAHRVLVVIDEAARALARDDAQIIVRSVAEQARKFKINLLLGAQNAAEKELPGIVRLVNNRFVGLVANAQVSSQLTGQAGLEAHRLTGAGDFLHVCGATADRLQVARTEDVSHLPRVLDVPEPQVEPVDMPEVVNLAIAKPTGRPAIELEGRHLAAFSYYGPKTITQAIARSDLDLKRDGWRLHRDFALAVEASRVLWEKHDAERYPSSHNVARFLATGKTDDPAALEVGREMLRGLAYLEEEEGGDETCA